MATNKNHHFVPRCYLRSFTRDRAGRAINLYNIDQERLIPDAPVKSQCSGDYFYGDDPRLEAALQAAERAYGEVTLELQRGAFQLSPPNETFVKRFLLLQYHRTDSAAKRGAEMMSGMKRFLPETGAAFRTQIREAVQLAMTSFVDNITAVDDLHVCLFRNRTRVPFVTSDDPVILTNRWHLQNKPAAVASFGLGSAGVLLFLPITPTLLCMAYDADIYTVITKAGFADVRDPYDVHLLNEHQYLNCRANIFVESAADEALVSDGYRAARGRRPESRYLCHYAVMDEPSHADQGYQSFTVVDYDQAEPHRQALIALHAVHARPSAWPRMLRWRVNGKLYTNGNGASFLRCAHVPPSGGFQKVCAKQA